MYCEYSGIKDQDFAISHCNVTEGLMGLHPHGLHLRCESVPPLLAMGSGELGIIPLAATQPLGPLQLGCLSEIKVQIRHYSSQFYEVYN